MKFPVKSHGLLVGKLLFSLFLHNTDLLSIVRTGTFLFRRIRGPLFPGHCVRPSFICSDNRRLLCRTALRHRFTAFGIVMGGPQLIIGHLLFCQRVEIPKLTPCPE